MRIGGCLIVLGIAIPGCARILGIDGRYVLGQKENGDSGQIVIGAGGVVDSGSAAGGQGPASGGSGASAGGLISAGGMSMGAGGAGGTPPGTGGSTGGSESGGVAGTGGTIAVDAQAPCPSGQKRCPTVGCVTPDPSVGCDPAAVCTACDFPMNSRPICTGATCDYECYQNYTRNSTTGACEQTASGTGGAGAGGAGGTSSGRPGSTCTKGTATSASPECKGCPPPGVGCCNSLTLHCGCLWVVPPCI